MQICETVLRNNGNASLRKSEQRKETIEEENEERGKLPERETQIEKVGLSLKIERRQSRSPLSASYEEQ